MRFRLLVLAALALRSSGTAQTDHRLEQALPEIAKQASRFWQAAPGFVARESLKQKAAVPASHRRLRVGQAALQPRSPVLKDREIASWYGFSAYKAAPEALHEVRKIVAVDEKSIRDPETAQGDLRSVLQSKDDARKQALLKDFEKANLNSAAIDFGQLILLFTRSKLEQYSFELNNTGMVGADQALVISFRQNGGDSSLRIVEAGKRMRRPLEGEVWVRKGDFAVLRITLKTVRMDDKSEIRDEARVDYAANPSSAVLPASVIYRRFVNDQLYVENISQYSDWRLVEAK